MGIKGLGMLVLGTACLLQSDAPEEARINQMQVIGTHNSYHIAPAPETMKLIAATNKKGAESLDYTHRPLTEQFSRLGIRQIELDIYADPKGDLFTKPAIRKLLSDQGKDAGPDPNANGELAKPGMKLLHIKDIDFLSTAPTFVTALKQVREWSNSHRDHVPIFILVELKADSLPGLSKGVVPFNREQLDAVDAEIRSVFPKEQILTPDDVRGNAASLSEVIKTKGWPTIRSSRGKVMFGLDNEGKERDLYLQDHPALKGRAMFVSMPSENDPATAWFKINDPVQDHAKIQRLVKAGFMVRTRADSDTSFARKNDTAQRESAFSSGAQFISTDYAEARPEFSSYSVRFGDGKITARPNPVSSGKLPSHLDLENLRMSK